MGVDTRTIRSLRTGMRSMPTSGDGLCRTAMSRRRSSSHSSREELIPSRTWSVAYGQRDRKLSNTLGVIRRPEVGGTPSTRWPVKVSSCPFTRSTICPRWAISASARFEKNGPGPGYLDPVATPDEQENPKLILQLLQLTAERGLGHVQQSRCTAEASGSGDLGEVTQLANIHGLLSARVKSAEFGQTAASISP